MLFKHPKNLKFKFTHNKKWKSKENDALGKIRAKKGKKEWKMRFSKSNPVIWSEWNNSRIFLNKYSSC